VHECRGSPVAGTGVQGVPPPRPPGLPGDTDECAGLPGSPPRPLARLVALAAGDTPARRVRLTRRAGIPTLPA